MKQIRAFVAVNEFRSFARAAEHLHLSQPALSETISQLEAIVGARLLQRTTRSMQLTPLGAYFLPRARSLAKDLDRVMADLADIAHLQRGHVDIGCLASIAYKVLPRILASFQSQHPGISLHLRDDNAAGLQRLVLTREVDFAITSVVDDAAAVEFRSLRREEFRCLCLSDHPLAGRDQVTWRELSSYAFLGWAKGTANRYAIDSSLESAGIELSPAFEVSQLGTMLGMVDMGLGVAAVPSLACPTSPRHASPRLLEPEVTREIGIAVLAGNPLTLAAEAFIGAVTEWLNPVGCC